MSIVKVVYPRPEHVGWSSLTRMAGLLAHCLEADLEVLPGYRGVSRWRQATRRVPRRRGGPRNRRGEVLLVAGTPADLDAVLRPDHFLRGWDRVSAWVVDSFRDEAIPDVARSLGHFDHLFVGDAEVVDIWEKVTRTPVTWVPFGTDALAADWQRERTVDLLRVGRQPPSWTDDASTAVAARRHGVAFAGSAPFGATHEQNNVALDEAMASARFTLSFSNTVAPSSDTHPKLEYLTARWLDAAAHGAVVAGATPRCQSSRRLLWPAATLELGTTDLDVGLDVVREAVSAWTPDVARENHRRSLERTDWRWRFLEVVAGLGLDVPATLAAEVDRLRTAVADPALGGS